MNLTLELNLIEWLNNADISIRDRFIFDDIQFIQVEEGKRTDYDKLIVEFDTDDNEWSFSLYNENQYMVTYGIESVIRQYLGSSIIINSNVNDNVINYIQYLTSNNFINLDLNGTTTFITFRLNSARNTLNKSLIGIGAINGKFKAPLGIKSIEIDVVNYDIANSYNYIFIPCLGRYYYVTNIQLVTNDFTRLLLQEDVLMTWKNLIKSQNAFITRWQNSTNKLLVDSRYPLNDVPSVSKITLTNTSATSSKVNVTLKMDTLDSIPNFLIATKVKWNTSYGNDVDTPSLDSGYLPSLAPHNAPQQRIYFMKRNDVDTMFEACINDDATASYLDAIIWLPFDPTTAFNLNTPDHNNLYIGNKQLRVTSGNNSFVDRTQGLPTLEQPVVAYDTVTTNRIFYQSRYLCIFDGKYEVDRAWQNFEPYTHYELYVPFVGYVDVQAREIINKRILIYYAMDIKTGQATAYIYNYDNKVTIWSGGCQLGIKLDVTLTNQLENTKQKQSLDLNMVLGLVSSAVSIGIGVASENPVAIVGGVLSASKTIASNVNANRMLFNKAQTTYGSYDGATYSLTSVFLKVTKNYPVLDQTGYAKYIALEGLPYNNYAVLTSLTGYVEIGDINFDAKGSNIYSDEISEIVALLKGGVIF